MKGYATLPNCVTCGRFCTCEPGASWRMVYSGGLSLIVITGRKGGGITVEFANTDWSETWARDCGSLEEAFQAIRDELRPRPDNVFHLAREALSDE